MTATTGERPAARLALHTRVPRGVIGVTLATFLSLALNWPLIRATFQGVFADPDDAMRLVEVRAWMAGQPWFDVSALRLDPPTGASMHWSRLVDLPNAGLIWLFSLVTPQAEAWDRLVLPTLFLAALYAGVARLATVVLGKRAQGPALLGMFLTGVTLVQVQPGRIGHHGPETVALVWAVAASLASFDPGRARQAALAGALVAVSLAISLETLPFLGGLAAAMVAVWAVRGVAAAAPLRWFALGLGATLPCLFFATVDPRAWLAPVCDALGAAHLGAGVIFVLGCLGLAAVTSRLSTRGARIAAAAIVAGGAGLFVAVAFPMCLRSPFAGVDPLVRALWLDHVVESEPLLVFLRDHPATGLAIVLPMGLGTLANLAAALSLRGAAAARFAILAGLGVLGLAAGFWQVRVFGSVAPLAVCGGVYAVCRLEARLRAAGLATAALIAPAAMLPFTATAWAIVLPQDAIAAGPSGAACFSPAALLPLRLLPPGRVVAPLEVGSHLLETTGLTVFAAPYHRNDDGNRFAFDVMLASPNDARSLLAARNAAYVMTCDGLGETHRLAARAPDGLAAQLQAEAVPAFLTKLDLPGTPYRVFAVQRPDGR